MCLLARAELAQLLAPFPWFYGGTLKLHRVGVFTPWKLARCERLGLLILFQRLNYQTFTSTKLKMCGRMFTKELAGVSDSLEGRLSAREHCAAVQPHTEGTGYITKGDYFQ